MTGDEPVTIGEVNRNVEKLTESVERLRDSLASTYVVQSTWSQRNETVNQKFDAMGREIGELRRALDKKADAAAVTDALNAIRTAIGELKAPPRWPAVVSAVVACAALVVATVR